MSEKAPKITQEASQPDNEQALSPMAQEYMDKLKSNYGDNLFTDTGYQDAVTRIYEADAYDKHLEKLANRADDPYDFSHSPDGYAQQNHELTESIISGDPTLSEARKWALKVAKFSGTPHEQRAKDQFDRLVAEYEEREDYDPIIAAAIDELAIPSTLEESDTDTEGHDVSSEDEEKKTSGKDKAPVDEADPASQALDLISAWNDAESRKGIKEDPEKLKALSEELAKLQKELDEAAKAADETNKKAKTLKNWGGGISALQEPKETREDEEAHHFVKDREDAHEQAIPINAEFDADVAAKEAEADKTRVHDKNEAWTEALLEQDRRDLPEDWDEALVEQEERRLRDWDAAIEEDKWRNRFQPTPAPQRRRFERTRSRLEKMFGTPTKKALGVLALAAATGALGWALSPDKAADSHVDSGTNATATPDKPSETKTPVNAEAKPKTAHEKLLESPAWNIPNGGGGEQMMNRLHVDKGVWYANEAEFLKEHPDEAYRMSDGHVGFSDPGKLSMNSIKFWADKVEHQNQK